MYQDKLVGQLRVMAAGTRNIVLNQYLHRTVNALKKGSVTECDKQELAGAFDEIRCLYGWGNEVQA